MPIDLTNVITVSVSTNPAGLGAYNINNLALFSSETPVDTPYGDYRVYRSAAEVGTDWGTSSETYQQALAVFSQQPNILAGNGELIIFPIDTGSAETLAQAIARTKDMIFYCGIISTQYPAAGDMKTLADTIQSYGDKILFLPSADSNDIAGDFTDIKNAADTYTRCLYYSTSALNARLFAAAAAGRGMSVNFEASNTALTMNLKQLATIDADTGITQTVYSNCKTAGVDVYTSIAGVSAYFSHGNNKFFDEVHNLIWFVSAVKVTGFNTLLQLGNKIPQTEPGMNLLKGAYREVCERAVKNGYVAPGSWTSAEWFGNQEDMIKNIQEHGYYIYSTPISQQSAAARAARQSPLVQIALKEAGAIHSTDLLIKINP